MNEPMNMPVTYDDPFADMTTPEEDARLLAEARERRAQWVSEGKCEWCGNKDFDANGECLPCRYADESADHRTDEEPDSGPLFDGPDEWYGRN